MTLLLELPFQLMHAFFQRLNLFRLGVNDLLKALILFGQGPILVEEHLDEACNFRIPFTDLKDLLWANIHTSFTSRVLSFFFRQGKVEFLFEGGEWPEIFQGDLSSNEI